MAKKAKSHGIGDIYKFLLVILVLLLSYYLVKSYMDYLKKKEGYTSADFNHKSGLNEEQLIKNINNRIKGRDFTGAMAGIKLSEILFPPTQELMVNDTIESPRKTPGGGLRREVPFPPMKPSTGGIEVPPPS